MSKKKDVVTRVDSFPEGERWDLPRRATRRFATPVRGMASSYSLSRWRALGYDTTKEPVGSYLFTLTRVPASASVRTIPMPGIGCPYCHDPLERLDARDGDVIGRILKAAVAGDTVRVVVDPVPAGIIVAKCNHCRNVFSVHQ